MISVIEGKLDRGEIGSSVSGDGLGTVSSRSRWSSTDAEEGPLTFDSEPERDQDAETGGSDSESGTSTIITINDDEESSSECQLLTKPGTSSASSSAAKSPTTPTKPAAELTPLSSAKPTISTKTQPLEDVGATATLTQPFDDSTHHDPTTPILGNRHTKNSAHGEPSISSQDKKKEIGPAPRGSSSVDQVDKQEKVLAEGESASTVQEKEQGEQIAHGIGGAQNKKVYTLKACVTALGFRNEKEETGMRKNFLKDLNGHVKEREQQHLHSQSDPVPFDAMIAAFMDQYGNKYFGPTDRGHLQERDPEKGNLWPRDAETR